MLDFFFQRVRIKSENSKKLLFIFFKKIFIELEINKVNRTVILRTIKNKKNEIRSRAFYLKVNTLQSFSTICLQKWVNVANQLNYDFFIICDKKELLKKIRNEVYFYDTKINFLKSDRSIGKRNIARRISDKNWRFAALAHMTPFFHARKNNYDYFWNIDADDTCFLLPAKQIATFFIEIENYAIKKEINSFSLDMWYSFSEGRHWSFGVNLINNKYDWISEFKKIKDDFWINWIKKNKKAVMINIDWFFNYLKDYRGISIESFYIEQLFFIHFEDFPARIIHPNLYYWNNGELLFPVFYDLFNCSKYGCYKIPNDVIRFDFDINKNDCISYYIDNLLRKFGKNVQID